MIGVLRMICNDLKSESTYECWRIIQLRKGRIFSNQFGFDFPLSGFYRLKQTFPVSVMETLRFVRVRRRTLTQASFSGCYD